MVFRDWIAFVICYLLFNQTNPCSCKPSPDSQKHTVWGVKLPRTLKQPCKRQRCGPSFYDHTAPPESELWPLPFWGKQRSWEVWSFSSREHTFSLLMGNFILICLSGSAVLVLHDVPTITTWHPEAITSLVEYHPLLELCSATWELFNYHGELTFHQVLGPCLSKCGYSDEFREIFNVVFSHFNTTLSPELRLFLIDGCKSCFIRKTRIECVIKLCPIILDIFYLCVSINLKVFTNFFNIT